MKKILFLLFLIYFCNIAFASDYFIKINSETKQVSSITKIEDRRFLRVTCKIADQGFLLNETTYNNFKIIYDQNPQAKFIINHNSGELEQIND